VDVFYVSIRTAENYEFDQIKTARLTENANKIKNSQGDNFVGFRGGDHPNCPPWLALGLRIRPTALRAHRVVLG